ncbi:MAG: hypothetical protein JST44_11600 [Cyanobacteria bacterium SZAS LIN-5]|nr:hypothetical protein [Cyanobacteria bacterium SZAS LIN-5]
MKTKLLCLIGCLFVDVRVTAQPAVKIPAPTAKSLYAVDTAPFPAYSTAPFASYVESLDQADRVWIEKLADGINRKRQKSHSDYIGSHCAFEVDASGKLHKLVVIGDRKVGTLVKRLSLPNGLKCPNRLNRHVLIMFGKFPEMDIRLSPQYSHGYGG